jgi:hypothetical protein
VAPLGLAAGIVAGCGPGSSSGGATAGAGTTAPDEPAGQPRAVESPAAKAPTPTPPLAPPAAAAPTLAGGLGEVKFESITAELGQVGEGSIAQHLFRFENVGKGDLVIKDVRASCGCTVPEVRLFDAADPEKVTARITVPGKAPVQASGGKDAADLPAPTEGKPNDLVRLPPGGKAGILAQINTQGLVAGAKNATIWMTSDDARQAQVTLTMQCKIVKIVDVAPPTLNFAALPRIESKSLEATITPSEAQDLVVNVPGTLPDALKVELSPMPDAETKGAWKLRVTLGPNAPIGFFTHTLVLPTNHPAKNEIRIPVVAQVQPNVLFEPERLYFGGVKKGSPAEAAVEIKSLDATAAFEVQQPEVRTKHDGVFTATVETIEAGKRYKVRLVVDGNVTTPYFSGSVVVKTTHPDLPEKEVVFYGYLQQ